MQQGIEMGYLLCRERRTGLLTVAEGGIGYPKLLGSVHGYIAMVEGHLGDGVVVEQVAVELRLGHILKLVVVGRLLQAVGAPR